MYVYVYVYVCNNRWSHLVATHMKVIIYKTIISEMTFPDFLFSSSIKKYMIFKWKNIFYYFKILKNNTQTLFENSANVIP